ncbi:MAG: SAM-dependent chlorinase/fluorinase [Candidatus Latescibacterota bacterium]|nr:MAG: SAM-dependent chlorinase/fluorinase [Candidatus Latescibacterota bacterium]
MTSIPDDHNASPPVVGLLTDFGSESFYVGAMKGAILSVAPNATLVDITHGIHPYAIDEASFVLARVFDLFPPASVCVAVVDPGVGGARRNVVFAIGDRHVVAPDNGLVSDVAGSFEIQSVYTIDDEAIGKIRRHRPSGRTFLGRDVFGPAAGYLAAGGPVEKLGDKVVDYQSFDLPPVRVAKGKVRGIGRYVDPFGNIITNVSLSHLRAAFGDAPLAEIQGVVDTNIGIDGIEEYFAKGEKGSLMLIVGSWGLVEIVVNQGSAFDRFDGQRSVGIELSRASK